MGLLDSGAQPQPSGLLGHPMLLHAAQLLQHMGTGGDTILAHINSREAALLKSRGGAGTVNPQTGLLQFEGTGGEGSGEGPGSDGPTGASGPGTGADSSGTGAGGVGGPSDGLTGQESETAVESGEIPGTPVGVADQNSIGQAAMMGQLGMFGQPTIGSILNGLVNGVANNVNGVVQGKPEVIGKMAINGLLGLTPVGAINSISGLLGGPTVGSVAMGMLGKDNPNAGAPSGVSAGSPTAGVGVGPTGAAPGGPGNGLGGPQQPSFLPPLPGPPSIQPQPQASPFAFRPLQFGQPLGLLGQPANPLLR